MSASSGESAAHVRSHAKWVLHCIEDGHDFDYLPGDVRSAMASMARTIVRLTTPLPRPTGMAWVGHVLASGGFCAIRCPHYPPVTMASSGGNDQ